MEISIDVEINSPKSKVWAAITDIANCTDMISGIVDLKVLEQPEDGLVGLKWIETRKIFGKEASETMWITESEEGSYYCTRAENHGSIYLTKMSVEEVSGKTRLTMAFKGTSDSFFVRLISAVMTIFVKKSMTKLVQQDLQDIKNYVETH